MKVDPKRLQHEGHTGIVVRAQHEMTWGAHDIACLDTDSLTCWLRVNPERSIKVVLSLLGHEVTT